MHPGRCARVLLDGAPIGFIGELHPKWRQAYDFAQAPVMFELELDAVLQRQVPQFKKVAKHQAVERDIAVMVGEKVTIKLNGQLVVDEVVLENYWDPKDPNGVYPTGSIELQNHGNTLYFKNVYVRELPKQ